MGRLFTIAPAVSCAIPNYPIPFSHPCPFLRRLAHSVRGDWSICVLSTCCKQSLQICKLSVTDNMYSCMCLINAYQHPCDNAHVEMSIQLTINTKVIKWLPRHEGSVYKLMIVSLLTQWLKIILLHFVLNSMENQLWSLSYENVLLRSH